MAYEGKFVKEGDKTSILDALKRIPSDIAKNIQKSREERARELARDDANSRDGVIRMIKQEFLMGDHARFANLSKFFNQLEKFQPDTSKDIQHRYNQMESYLKQLNSSQVSTIKDCLNNMAKLLESAGIDSEALANAENLEKFKDNEKVQQFLVLGDAINETLNQLDKLPDIRDFGSEHYDRIARSISDGKNGLEFGSVSTADLEIVSALRMTGVNLKLVPDKDANNPWKWEYTKDTPLNEFALVSKKENLDDMPFVFDEDKIKIIVNYLNSSDRSRPIVANQVLKLFYEQMDEKMSNLSENEKNIRKQGFWGPELKQKYRADSPEFKFAKLTDPNYILRVSQLQSLKDVFSSKNTQAINRELSSNEDRKAGNYKDIEDSLSALQNNILAKLNQFGIINEFDKDNVLDEYNTAIDYFKKLSGDHSSEIDKLTTARDTVQASIDFQTTALQGKEELSATQLVSRSNDIVKQMYNRGGLTKSENGEFEFENGGDEIMYEELLKRVNDKYAKGQSSEGKSSEPTSEKNVQFVDIYNSLYNLLGSKAMGDGFTNQFTSVIDEVGWLDFAKEGFLSGLLEGQLNDLLASNKDKTFAEVFDTLKEQYKTLISPELMEEAYVKTHPDTEFAKAKAESIQKKSEERDKKWIKNLVYLDVASSMLSPEEYKQYNDPKTPQDVKDKLIQGKLTQAIADVDKMPTDKYNQLVENAKKKHHNNLIEREMGSQLEELINNPNLSKEQQVKMFPVFKKYLDVLGKKQKQNDAELGIKKEEKEPEEKKEEKPGKLTFGKLYPSSPNLEKYKKLMKPFHGKEIVKYFFEPLLVAIDKMEINREAYEARNTSSYSYVEPETNQMFQQQEQQPQQKKPVIRQNDFEASMFMPGYFAVADICNRNPSPEMNDLRDTLAYLSTTNGEFNSFKDSMRHLMFDICAGKYQNSAQVLSEIDANAIGANPQEVLQMKKTFANMNPYLVYQLLSFSSTEKKGADGKPILQLGDMLPMDELCKAKDDASRGKAVKAITPALIQKQIDLKRLQIDDLISPLIVTTKNLEESKSLFDGLECAVDLKQVGVTDEIVDERSLDDGR